MSAKAKIQEKVFYSFHDYLRNFHRKLTRVLPEKASETYAVFKSGSALLFRDMLAFSEVYDLLSSTDNLEKACRTLSYKDLELYLSLPNDLYVVMPVLLLAALPVVGYAVMALAMVYPRYMLSSHFWTAEVRKEVREAELRRRHAHYRQLLEELPRYAKLLKGKPHYGDCKSMFEELDRGEFHPGPAEVLAVRGLFAKGAVFDVRRLRHLHVRRLMKIHGLNYLTWWRFKLTQYGNLLLEMDKALERDGGPGALSHQELKMACFRRGLRVNDLERDEMEDYLEKWLAISSVVDSSCVSLVLHLPVLLGINKKTRYRKKPSLRSRIVSDRWKSNAKNKN